MRRTVVILISGKRYAGKDEAAKVLTQIHKKISPLVRPLAYYPKRDFSTINSLNLDRLLNDREYKEIYREGIIDLAMGHRKIDDLVWVKSLYNDCLTPEKGNRCVVVPDHRFKNEYEYLSKFEHLDVKRIRVVADENTLISRGWVYNPLIDNSASETELTDQNTKWDYAVTNNGDIKNLYKNMIYTQLL